MISTCISHIHRGLQQQLSKAPEVAQQAPWVGQPQREERSSRESAQIGSCCKLQKANTQQLFTNLFTLEIKFE